MPSPFPGMDPYLESSQFFPELHDALIMYLREALQNALPESYYAQSRARVWIEPSSPIVEPDFCVACSRDRARTDGSGAVAVDITPVVVPAAGEEVSESYLEIHTVKGEYSLITVIEVLSSLNKTSGTHGRTQYARMHEVQLKSRVNLVEIDLLRGGQPSTAVIYHDAVAAAGSFDYHVCVRRMDDLQQYHVYPIRLKACLPQLLIPLLPGDGDVKIDLQAVFDRCYDTGPYRVENPYGFTPEPSLNPEQAAWAASILREKGQTAPA